jgi:hypothetical protein
VTATALIGRQDVVEMLAAAAGGSPDTVPERIDSLGLAWLLHEFERRYGIPLDLGDEVLDRMTTVSSAVEILRAAQARAIDG